MAVRIIKKSWWVDLRFNHTRYRKRSPENSRAGAQAYEATLRQKLARGESIDRPIFAVQSFESFAARWFEEYVVPNNKYSEQRTKSFILKAALVPFFGRYPIPEITARHIEQFRAQQLQRRLSHKTVNNQVAILNKCLSKGYEWLNLEGTPPKVKPLTCPPPTTTYLTQEECARLLAYSGGITHDMLLVAMRTGLRRGEIKGLQWSSIDWVNRSLIVRHSYCEYQRKIGSPKSNRERYIPLDTEVYETLFRVKQPSGFVFQNERSNPFSHKRMAEELTATCRKAGVRRITWHALRHTFASHLAMRGVPLNAVQALLGHSAIATTMRYAHVAPSTLRSAIELLGSENTDLGKFGQPVGNQQQPLQHAIN